MCNTKNNGITHFLVNTLIAFLRRQPKEMECYSQLQKQLYQKSILYVPNHAIPS